MGIVRGQKGTNMFFSILSAYSTRNLDLVLDLNHNGNKRTVTLYSKKEHRCIVNSTFDSSDPARALFDSLCRKYDMNVIEELDTSEVYDFINSQY